MTCAWISAFCVVLCSHRCWLCISGIFSLEDTRVGSIPAEVTVLAIASEWCNFGEGTANAEFASPIVEALQVAGIDGWDCNSTGNAIVVILAFIFVTVVLAQLCGSLKTLVVSSCGIKSVPKVVDLFMHRQIIY